VIAIKILLLAAITYGIFQSAPIEKIRKAYRKLALLYHPDRNQNNPEASAKFIMISKAYECLTDE